MSEIKPIGKTSPTGEVGQKSSEETKRLEAAENLAIAENNLRQVNKNFKKPSLTTERRSELLGVKKNLEERIRQLKELLGGQ